MIVYTHSQQEISTGPFTMHEKCGHELFLHMYGVPNGPSLLSTHAEAKSSSMLFLHLSMSKNYRVPSYRSKYLELMLNQNRPNLNWVEVTHMPPTRCTLESRSQAPIRPYPLNVASEAVL